MKKYIQKSIKLLLSMLALIIFLPSNVANASITHDEYHPQDIINNESLYDEVIALTIEGNETELLSQIDYSRFSQLKEIWLVKTALLDGNLINLDSPITSLNVRNSIINLSTIDLDDYNSISLVYAYIIGDKVESSKIDNNEPLNEEYKLNINNVFGLQTYEEKINDIAKEIYSQSDGTDVDIIRLVTLYVLEHLEYDYNNLYSGLPLYKSIIDYEKGVCSHYSNFESRLLNKLGIFAMDIGGCADLSDCMNSAHAWTIVYTDGSWYYIDPTWIDDNDSIEALKNKNYESSSSISLWYMIPTNDTSSPYNTQRRSDFTMQNSIPIEYRVSKMSILDEILPNSENIDEEGNDGTSNSSSENETMKVPDTGLFTSNNSFATRSIILIIIMTITSIIILLITIINRIIRKNKINNF